MCKGRTTLSIVAKIRLRADTIILALQSYITPFLDCCTLHTGFIRYLNQHVHPSSYYNYKFYNLTSHPSYQYIKILTCVCPSYGSGDVRGPGAGLDYSDARPLYFNPLSPIDVYRRHLDPMHL